MAVIFFVVLLSSLFALSYHELPNKEIPESSVPIGTGDGLAADSADDSRGRGFTSRLLQNKDVYSEGSDHSPTSEEQ